MNEILMIAGGAVVGSAVAWIISKLIFDAKLKSVTQDISLKNKNIDAEIALKLSEAEKQAEIIKQRKHLEGKEKFMQMKAENEKEINQRNQAIIEKEKEFNNRNLALIEKENKAKQLEQSMHKAIEETKRKEGELEKQKENYTQQAESYASRKADLEHNYKQKLENVEKTQMQLVTQLETIAGMTREEAKALMLENLKDVAKSEAKSYIQEITEEAKVTATKEAKKIVMQTVQRVATEQAIENSISIFNVDDEVKGRIIGREGRNIRALEAATGIEIIVDDTPDAIILSGFDAVRREIARLALHRLVADGRIHPARIEEVVEKTRKQIEEEMVQIGERTAIDLGIHGLHHDLIKLVGRMRYRSSYGQNLLQHSREVANLCAIMAAELGLNVKLAKRAGLLHDIGKVSDEDPELPHALLGMKIAERCKEHPSILNAIGAHHDEIEMTDVLSPIIQVCDAISGARPGARREVFEQYTKRLKDLEKTALSYDGVQKAYAIQAGRELRVIVESEKITDTQADTLAYDISTQIQTEMTYPGQIKITVIREKRAVAFAK